MGEGEEVIDRIYHVLFTWWRDDAFRSFWVCEWIVSHILLYRLIMLWFRNRKHWG